MNDIELTGLHADTPIGAMAAFGCLRICQGWNELRGSKLGWEPIGGSFTAVLRMPARQSADELITLLMRSAAAAASRPS